MLRSRSRNNRLRKGISPENTPQLCFSRVLRRFGTTYGCRVVTCQIGRMPRSVSFMTGPETLTTSSLSSINLIRSRIDFGISWPSCHAESGVISKLGCRPLTSKQTERPSSQRPNTSSTVSCLLLELSASREWYRPLIIPSLASNCMALPKRYRAQPHYCPSY